MPQIILSLGSNQQPAYYLEQALVALSAWLTSIRVSAFYQSKAVGVQADDFVNTLVVAKTSLEKAPCIEKIKALETQLGRIRPTPASGSVSMDIDLIAFDCEVMQKVSEPEDAILSRSYVLEPLAEMLPDWHHPTRNTPISKLYSASPMALGPELRVLGWAWQSEQKKLINHFPEIQL